MNYELLREKKDIIDWLKNYNIENFDLIKNSQYGFVVDIYGNVDLNHQDLKKIGIKFNIVKGRFSCFHNRLNSLKGAPEIVEGNFRCSHNKLKNLEYAPYRVTGHFICSDNELISLKGAPREISGNFYCHNNKLKNLKGAPNNIEGGLDCSNNKLINIEGQDLPNIEGEIYLNKNIKLGNLQKVRDPKQLKDILKVKEESNLLNSILIKPCVTNKAIKL